MRTRLLYEMFLTEAVNEMTRESAERMLPGSTAELPNDPQVRLHVIDGTLLAGVPGKLDSLQWSERSRQWEPV
jgi:hypothetical protein